MSALIRFIAGRRWGQVVPRLPPLSLHPGVQGLEEPAVHVVLGQQQPARHRLTHQVVGIDHQVPHVQAGQRHATRAGHYENRKLV